MGSSGGLTTTKISLKNRLMDAGDWEAFKLRREKLKNGYRRDGLPLKEAVASAWKQCEREFPPLVTDIEALEAWNAAYGDKPETAPEPKPEPKPEPETDAPAPEAKPEKKPTRVIDASPEECKPRKTVDLAIIDKLVLAVGSRESSQDRCVRWVQNKIKTPWHDIDSGEVPCQFAITLLEHAKSTTGFDRFMADWAPKLMPSKTQIDAQESHRDDGRELFTLIDQLAAVAAVDEPGEIRKAG